METYCTSRTVIFRHLCFDVKIIKLVHEYVEKVSGLKWQFYPLGNRHVRDYKTINLY